MIHSLIEAKLIHPINSNHNMIISSLIDGIVINLRSI